MEAPNPVVERATCPRCSGRGQIICPECKGTGETRDTSWVVTGRCTVCVGNRGFVTCPKCQGAGFY